MQPWHIPNTVPLRFSCNIKKQKQSHRSYFSKTNESRQKTTSTFTPPITQLLMIRVFHLLHHSALCLHLHGKKIQQSLRTFFFCKSKRHQQLNLWLLYYLFNPFVPLFTLLSIDPKPLLFSFPSCTSFKQMVSSLILMSTPPTFRIFSFSDPLQVHCERNMVGCARTAAYPPARKQSVGQEPLFGYRRWKLEDKVQA